MSKIHRLLAADANRKEHHCTETFTPRQVEILKHLAQGKQNKRIAHDLGISENTVKVHMRHIMKTLDAQNRTQVVLLTRSLNGNGSTPIEE